MSRGNFRYRREDFGPLSVELEHLDLYLNFLEDYIETQNTLTMKALLSMSEVTLDAKDLEIVKIEWIPIGQEDGERPGRLGFTYITTENKLIINLPEKVEKGEVFKVRTTTRLRPSDNILEGIYKDVTPPNSPQQYMSQCQQWGFQRIAPIIDDCRAKCPMRTTLEGDHRYTHLISNGNIDMESNPEGKPVLKEDDKSRQVIRYVNPIPMAPYLFIAAAGVWDTLADAITYDNGDSVKLEYLVPVGRVEHAKIPMEILKEAVLWIARTQDYYYAGDTYRTICMTKSNFGGMENVGNTTIVTDAALIDEHTLDQSLIYAHGVIVHEFEHNQCGSETTMETPFDVWLNEAYTVDVERQFLADCFDPAFTRLSQVDSIRSPLLGPLAIEDSGVGGRIVREGFNDPDELIDGVTYVKAAEVIRMLRLIIGEEDFTRSKDLYFSRYHNSNANTDQFFECFEEISGRSLRQFKEGWLLRRGYPQVRAHSNYNPEDQSLSLIFEQKVEDDGEPFHAPVEIALVNDLGENLEGTERVFQLTEKRAELRFDQIEEPPAVISLNRGYSFYGAFSQPEITREQLLKQARLDTDIFNRVEATRALTDIQRIELLEDPQSEIEPGWLELFREILTDESIAPGLKAHMLRIDEQPLDRRYSTWVTELVAAREKMTLALNNRFRPLLVEKFHSIDTYSEPASPKDGIEERMLKSVLLELIARDDSQESHDIIIRHLRNASAASDKVSALAILNRTSAGERLPILEEYYEKWRDHLSGYANYLRVIPAGTNQDVFEMIDREKNRPTFDINHPTWSRALFLPMAVNNKMVWTDRGLDWVVSRVVELASINEYTAGRLLNVLQHATKLRPGLRDKAMTALGKIVEQVPRDKSASVHAQATSYLGV
jgi:aminopeptidase N